VIWETYVRPRVREILEWKQRDYLTNSEIARNLGITIRQFNKVLSENKTLKDLMDKGDEYIVKQVEGALFKRAMGYEYDEESFEVWPSGKYNIDGTPIMLQKKRLVKKRVEGSVAAQQFLLTNLKPEKYQKLDKVDIHVVEPITIIDDLGGQDGNKIK